MAASRPRWSGWPKLPHWFEQQGDAILGRSFCDPCSLAPPKGTFYGLVQLQEDAVVGSAYFDPAVRNRTAKIVDFFLKYLTGG